MFKLDKEAVLQLKGDRREMHLGMKGATYLAKQLTAKEATKLVYYISTDTTSYKAVSGYESSQFVKSLLVDAAEDPEFIEKIYDEWTAMRVIARLAMKLVKLHVKKVEEIELNKQTTNTVYMMSDGNWYTKYHGDPIPAIADYDDWKAKEEYSRLSEDATEVINDVEFRRGKVGKDWSWPDSRMNFGRGKPIEYAQLYNSILYIAVFTQRFKKPSSKEVEIALDAFNKRAWAINDIDPKWIHNLWIAFSKKKGQPLKKWAAGGYKGRLAKTKEVDFESVVAEWVDLNL